MSLSSIITQIAAIEGDISGIKKAHDKAPSNINAFPCFINVPDSGEITRKPNTRWVTHHIKLELYVTKQIIPEAEALLRPILESTLNAFDAKLTLNGSASNSQITGYQYSVLSYNGQDYLGITFDLNAVEYSNVNMAA